MTQTGTPKDAAGNVAVLERTAETRTGEGDAGSGAESAKRTRGAGRKRGTRRARRKKKGAKRAEERLDPPTSLHTRKGPSSRPNLRVARREGYFQRATPAPSTSIQAQILNPALIAAPTDDEGVVIGRDMLSNSAVAHDPFTAYQRKIITSPAVVVLGVIGSGKSSLIKTVYVLRPIILKGRRAVVMDKKDRNGEGEYCELTRELGSSPFHFRVGGGGTVINPLDPTITATIGRARQLGLLRSMAERSANVDTLDPWQQRALRTAYTEVMRLAERDGREPLLSDLVRELPNPRDPERMMSAAAAERVHQAGLEMSFIFEAMLLDELSGLFDGPTSKHVRLNDKLTTFDISQLPEDGPANALVQAVAHSLVLARLRRDRGQGTNFVSEEGWSLVSGPVARQMNANQMLARGLGLSNVVAMHHVAQVAQDSEAKSLLREPQTVHIYQQDRAEDIAAAVDMYGLEDGSADALASLDQGNHLLKIGRRAEIHVQHTRSELEERLTETDEAMIVNEG